MKIDKGARKLKSVEKNETYWIDKVEGKCLGDKSRKLGPRLALQEITDCKHVSFEVELELKRDGN